MVISLVSNGKNTVHFVLNNHVTFVYAHTGFSKALKCTASDCDVGCRLCGNVGFVASTAAVTTYACFVAVDDCFGYVVYAAKVGSLDLKNVTCVVISKVLDVFQGVAPFVRNDFQFGAGCNKFFGQNLFVSPITNKKNIVIDRVIKKVFVPDGIWFNLLDGKQYNGAKYYTNFYRDEDYPVFVKAGSIIPMSYNIKEDIPSTLELNIYPLNDGTYNLYEDDGITNNYKKGMYMITNFSYHYEKDNYTLKISKSEGKNLLSKRNYLLRFKNTKNIKAVYIEDKSITYNCYYDKNDFIIQINNLIVGRDLEVNIKGENVLVSSIRLINEDIKEILYDLAINTSLKDKLDEILFSDLDVKKKRIKIRKLKKKGLDNKYIKIFINLLEYIQKI